MHNMQILVPSGVNLIRSDWNWDRNYHKLIRSCLGFNFIGLKFSFRAEIDFFLRVQLSINLTLSALSSFSIPGNWVNSHNLKVSRKKSIIQWGVWTPEKILKIAQILMKFFIIFIYFLCARQKQTREADDGLRRGTRPPPSGIFVFK